MLNFYTDFFTNCKSHEMMNDFFQKLCLFGQVPYSLNLSFYLQVKNL